MFIKTLSDRQNSKGQNWKMYLRPTNRNIWSTTGECPRAPTISPIYKQHLSLITFVKFHLFADDTCIFRSHHNISNLETELNIAPQNFTNWLRANKLTLNISKSNLLSFNVGNKPQTKSEIFNDYE